MLEWFAFVLLDYVSTLRFSKAPLFGGTAILKERLGCILKAEKLLRIEMMVVEK